MKIRLFPFRSASTWFLAPSRTYGFNAFSLAGILSVYSGKREPCSMPLSGVWKISLAVEGLLRLKVAGGPGYSTLINLSNQDRCDGLSGMLLGTLPNNVHILLLGKV